MCSLRRTPLRRTLRVPSRGRRRSPGATVLLFGFASRGSPRASRPSASSRRASVARASTRSRASARAWGPSSRRARRPGGTPRAKKTALKTTEKRRLNPARRSRLSPIPTPTRIRWSPSLGAVRSPRGPPSPPTPTRGFARRRRAASTWSSERRGSFATRRGRRDRSTARTTLRRTTPLWTTTLWTTTLWTTPRTTLVRRRQKKSRTGRTKQTGATTACGWIHASGSWRRRATWTSPR